MTMSPLSNFPLVSAFGARIWNAIRNTRDHLKSGEQSCLVWRADPENAVVPCFISMDVFDRKLCFTNSTHSINSNAVIILFDICISEFLTQESQNFVAPSEMRISLIRHQEMLRDRRRRNGRIYDSAENRIMTYLIRSAKSLILECICFVLSPLPLPPCTLKCALRWPPFDSIPETRCRAYLGRH